MHFIGIDPGFTGAVAVLDADGCIVALDDAPAVTVQSGKRKRSEFDRPAMVRLLRFYEPSLTRVAIEKVTPMPKQGIASTSRFMAGWGMWLGILACLQLPHELVTPQRWKRAMLAGQPKEKDASRQVAQAMWPDADLHLVKHHGRADALLIAEWLRRQVK